MKSDITINIIVLCLFTSAKSVGPPKSYSSYQLTSNRPRRQSFNNRLSCTLPSHPENGRWSLLNGEGAPGGKIDINSVLKFECNKGYKLSTTTQYKVCDNKWDESEKPQCEKLCPPMFSTPQTILKCVDKKGNITSCTEATEGSYLSYKCARFYETPFGYKKTLFCLDGTWNNPRPVCQPVCGKKVDDDVIPLIYGGTVKKVIEYPWIIALYQKMSQEYTNVCGGTMVTQNVILTAAHCVTNGYGDLLPKENYLVAAGKVHNKYNDSRDVNAQYLELSHITVHSSYRADTRRFLGDIAILITKRPFVLNELTQPVCFNNVNNIYIYAGSIGVVSGFGVKEGGLPSEELRTLEIPYKYETTCAQELPREWADKYSMIDKICAGFYNKSMSVCKGDSGNGLFFRNPEDNRYYIHGLVSIGPSEKGECNIQQNSLYTKVAFYYEFVDREISKHHVAECVLPPYPEHGKWTVESEEKRPGESAFSDTVLKYSCDGNYQLSSATSTVECGSIASRPTCQLSLQQCPQLTFPTSTDVTCTNEKGERISCARPTENTILTYTCPKGYTIPEGSKKVRHCKNGSWGLPSPECRPSTTPETVEEPSPKVVCTYASWHSYKGLNPEDFNATLCNYVIYAFIGIAPDGKVRIGDRSLDIGDNKRGLYYRVTDMKSRNRDLKVLLSVGGSGASNTSLYSAMAANPAKRSAFISSAISILGTYNFDGLDVEWHVPEVEDKSNYVTLLRELKQALKQRGWLLTATVRSHPDSTGYDGAQMNEILDWINVKTYDMYGDWSQNTGQNSALYPSSLENDWEKQHLSLDSAVKNWIKLGVEKKKLAPSIAFFGRSFTLLNKNQNGVHSPFTGAGPSDDDGGGIIKYSQICEKYDNWKRVWDDEQKNPYKYSEDKWIGYDDVESVRIKAAYIKENGYFGVNVWPLDGDDVHGKCGPKQVLLKEIHKALGSCPQPKFPTSTDFTCTNEKGEQISCAGSTENTVLTYTCPKGYKIPEGSTNVRQCHDGSWGLPPPECQPSTPETVGKSSQKVICTYASWQSHKGVNPEDFNATLCDYINYAFIGLASDGKVRIQDRPLDINIGDSQRGLYKRVVDMKSRNRDLKVLLSVGGTAASNSSLFSAMAADPVKRSAFISSAIDVINTYNFDGLDIEWLVPEVDDKNNYITLLREMKAALKQRGWLLSATVRAHLDSTGYDGPQMNEILDWVNVKTYDMYGGDWSKHTGQNSALYASSEENDWEQQHLNMDAASKNWITFGIEKNKLVPTIAFSGKSFTLLNKNQNGVYAPITGSGPSFDEAGGFLRYSQICDKFGSWTRVWDDEQKNPYKYSEDKWIGYDDAESVRIKAAYIKENGYFGVNVWPLDGDDVRGRCGTKQILIKEINKALGNI